MARVRVRVEESDAVAEERRALVQAEHLGLEVNGDQAVRALQLILIPVHMMSIAATTTIRLMSLLGRLRVQPD